MNTKPPVRPTRKRYQILALIFVTVVINYMDRSNISVAAFAISDELGLTTVQMGLIFSAFAWTYSALQIPGGILVDQIRPRILYPAIMILWSVATLVQGFANSIAALVGCRAAIGVFEAPSYPANNKIVTSWFPEKERASAIAIYTSGQFIGLAFLTPALILIQTYLGWRGLFFISGAIGIFWAVAWYFLYRSPQEHRGVNRAELELIAADGGLIETSVTDEERNTFSWKDLGEAFIHRKLWGVYLGQFCLGSLFIFFLTWFPTYLVKYRGLDFIKSGFLASVPFLAAFVGVLLSGFTSDALVRKGYTPEIARKAPILIGMLLSVSIIGANYTDSTFWVIFFLSVAFFGNGLASIAWVFISLLAPRRLIGLIGGVFNFIGGLAAALTPIVIGYLVTDSSFEPALFYIGAIAFLGFCSYLFLIGKVERIADRK
ncbi:MFS transporter [Flavilitoribacter nigricans]|uniref:MFS transporter n=1 Tax=Flavilitoribacter nigricans (strain ATCC 23147 / DSM 23189 / NBRC 102662 / NCIMB 1420 / SS-2) TaxID=1122177 RepID=A0A2D0N4M7_FLAN2|nr:MFS transporter [Flavilitoribacter nigricans]PHN02743.1 MFS transporter [Flavilitoribacter nigricans DSM 23189 = NBRC 102662]